MTSGPAERRFAAVRNTVAAFVPENGYEPREGVTREQVAEAIDALHELGQTERWRGALDTWRTWVMDEERRLAWAIHQGAMNAGHATW